MQRKSWVWMLASALLIFGGHAHAQRTEGDRAAASGPYEAEVAVRNQADSERNAAFGRALAVVLGKVTGDRGAAQRPGVRDELGKAKDYVAGYDYRQDEGVSSSGAPSFQTTLVTRFKRDDVDQLIQMLGLPNWPQPRPKPVLWLAINDGSGPRLVGLGQVNAARAILDQAKARGYALGLPGGNAAEQAAVGAIWRGDTAAIAGLSRKYSPPMQLIGKLQRGAGGWVADWIFVDKGKALSTWQTKHADARRAMAGGADGAADALFKRYAKAGSGGPAGTYRVRILGVDSADSYMQLIGYLGDVSIVKRISPVAAMPGELQLDLDLATGISGFARLVDRGGVLSTVSVGGNDTGDDKDGDAESTSRVATFRLGG
ncbi:DUF2066 domain-containing protein [Thermomonas sp. HDW16]|uniref:DUF2066 domain-containing protein n=1 Tax=Thermomonas sp. HDW16 TaxID=2714945 RepID=UPI0019801FBF|nr:DUF2066 domain-containing protein [Thermomonas sp. HDW16]